MHVDKLKLCLQFESRMTSKQDNLTMFCFCLKVFNEQMDAAPMKKCHCQKCHLSFGRRFAFTRHYRAVHLNIRFPCSHCSRTSSTECSLRRLLSKFHSSLAAAGNVGVPLAEKEVVLESSNKEGDILESDEDEEAPSLNPPPTVKVLWPEPAVAQQCQLRLGEGSSKLLVLRSANEEMVPLSVSKEKDELPPLISIDRVRNYDDGDAGRVTSTVTQEPLFLRDFVPALEERNSYEKRLNVWREIIFSRDQVIEIHPFLQNFILEEPDVGYMGLIAIKQVLLIHNHQQIAKEQEKQTRTSSVKLLIKKMRVTSVRPSRLLVRHCTDLPRFTAPRRRNWQLPVSHALATATRSESPDPSTTTFQALGGV